MPSLTRALFPRDQRALAYFDTSCPLRSVDSTADMASGPANLPHDQYGNDQDLIDPDDGAQIPLRSVAKVVANPNPQRL